MVGTHARGDWRSMAIITVLRARSVRRKCHSAFSDGVNGSGLAFFRQIRGTGAFLTLLAFLMGRRCIMLRLRPQGRWHTMQASEHPQALLN